MEVEQLDLVDLISERNGFIRKMIEEKWSEISDISVSKSEWIIMSKINKQKPTISSVTSSLQISRQATHKFIKKLESKGLIEIYQGSNKRDKCIQLTELGEIGVRKYSLLKKQVEKEIAEKVGNDQLNVLKKILNNDWGI